METKKEIQDQIRLYLSKCIDNKDIKEGCRFLGKYKIILSELNYTINNEDENANFDKYIIVLQAINKASNSIDEFRENNFPIDNRDMSRIYAASDINDLEITYNSHFKGPHISDNGVT